MPKNATPKSPSGIPQAAYLSPLAVWALSFGCAVGWGAFVMPGTTFLPIAGPLGTALGILFGTLAMGVIAINYHFLHRRHPDAGGAYVFVRDNCNRDHAFLCAWFLLLTYAALVWANTAALAPISRLLFGDVLQFGFHYSLEDFDVWGGECLASVAVLLGAGLLLSLSKRRAARLQTFLALVLLGGVAVAAASILRRHGGGWAGFAPAFAPGGNPPWMQVLGLTALAPWAFVGFESVSHSAEGFRFRRRRALWAVGAAIAAAAFVYAALAVAAAAPPPEGFADWSGYVQALPDLEGAAAIPVFHAVGTAMGPAGVPLLAATALAAALTGIIGFLTAASRLLVATARDGFFPRSLARLDRKATPRRAIWALVAVSCLVPLAGSRAIDWVVGVTTVGATIVYGYVSWCAFAAARAAKRRPVQATGLAGLLSAAAFAVCCMVPAFRTADAFATESYFILAVWGLVACLVFLRLTRQDTSASLGKSIAPWCALLFLIFFSTHMWVRRATSLVTGEVVHEVGVHYASSRGRGRPSEDDPYIRREERIIGNALTQYQFVQMGIVIAALAVMVGIYATVTRRERAAAKAKEYFFSTISHDIRTPLNAIIGYSDTLRLGSSSPADRDEAVSAIAASSRNLLRLVNDILDLSKLASGNLRTAPVPTDCTALLRDVAAIFGLAARQAGLDFRVAVPPMPRLLLDPVRLRQIAFNLVGNAVKFTERGHIEIRASFTPEPGTNAGEFALEIEDTGVGIAEEDIPRVTSAYVQVAAKFARNGGTGVGLAVCRQLVSAMGGAFAVRSALGEGSTFAVSFPRVKTADEEEGAAEHPVPPPAPLPALDAPAVPAAAEPVAAQAAAADGTGMPAPGTRLLLVDDSKMNLMVLKALLKRLGKYDIATAADGNEALSLLRDSGSAPFALVLTDYWMPNLDGAGLVSAIRSDPGLSGIPVQVVTADIELQSSYADKGFDGILLKPVTADVLRPLLPS